MRHSIVLLYGFAFIANVIQVTEFRLNNPQVLRIFYMLGQPIKDKEQRS